MREPQVDRFCRCVKKVRKTLKARPGSTPDQGGIAVCTKSVLQTKGRTLKKVNCSKHILETQPIKAGRRTRKQRNETIERNKTHVVYVKDDTIKTPVQSERIMGLPVGQAEALGNICKVQGSETIEANYLAKVPFAAALVLFFGKKPQVDILGAKHPRGNLPIEKAKGFAIVNFSGDDLELDALCAHESTRGKGVGANTLKYIESMATLNGKKRVLLDALPAAVPFYLKQGYKNTRDNFYAKELVPQTGGLFRWMGADTPVFNNQAVGAWNGFPIMLNETPEKKEQLNGWIAKYNPVVRVVSSADGELPIHEMVRGLMETTKPFNEPFVKMHFNLVAEPGSIYPVNFAKTFELVKTQGGDTKWKQDKLLRLADKFAGSDWSGLVTRTQKNDVYDLDPIQQRDAMCALLRVLLRIDGQIIHADLHRGNMAIMFDGTPVIHDVGRMRTLDTKLPGAPPNRIFRGDLLEVFSYPNYYMGYSQHFYIARMFKKIRKAYGQKYDPPTITEREVGYRVVYQDPPPSVDSMKRFEAWLDSKTTAGDETSYVQIARVYDILSVLKGLSNLSRLNKDKTPAEVGSVKFYARKAAVNLSIYLFSGYATKDNVVKIVRNFIALSGTRDQCGCWGVSLASFEAAEDKYAAEYMAKADETRGNNGLAPAPVAAKPPPQAPESLDLSAAGQEEKALRAQEDPLNEAMIESVEGPDASAIKVVTDTPVDVKAAAVKAFGPPEEENDIDVGAEVNIKDESAPPPKIKRVKGELREPRTGDGIFRLDSSGNLIEPQPEMQYVDIEDSGESPEEQRVVIDDSRESPAAQHVMIEDSAVTPATKSTGGRRTPKRKGLPRLL
jgi:GNAT superfamily N-acetyltransferase